MHDNNCIGYANSHIKVLLGMLDISLNLTVNVEVKLLGHLKRDQRGFLWVRFLTEERRPRINVNWHCVCVFYCLTHCFSSDKPQLQVVCNPEKLR